ncbi:Uncharacterised protein [Klebsiella pneumoniae]|nr:Uncharacterised protein [Klebsiella pneumoniae]
MIGTVHGHSIFIMVNGYIDTTPKSHLNPGRSAAASGKVINDNFTHG